MSEGNPNADPYTKAHLARSGRLPLTSTTARYFTANTDSEGDTLTSTCEYSIEGGALNARWWSIAVYDEHGSLIDNPSQRYSFNSEEAIRHSDGSYRITLASNARPENWLPSGSGPERNLVLMLRIYSPRETDSSGIGQIPDDRLPKDRAQIMQLRSPLLYVLLCLVLAGLIHIAAVLALPGLAPKNAWARLVPLGPDQHDDSDSAARPGKRSHADDGA